MFGFLFAINSLIDTSTIQNIFNISLICLFVFLVLGLLLSGVVGFFKGIYSTSFRLLFILCCTILAISLLPLSIDALSNFDVSNFSELYINLTFQETGQVISIQITSISETLEKVLAVLLSNFGYQGSSYELANLVVQLASMIISYFVIFIDGILIGIFGNLFGVILYQLIFKRFFTKIGRKIVKVRWASVFTEVVNYVVCACLFVFPFTSLVNLANQTWQKYSPTQGDETVQTIGSFLDTYNNSILAQTLFNWTTNSDGLTIDNQILSTILQTTVGDGQTSVIETLNNLGNIGGAVLDGLTIENSQVQFNFTYLLAEDTLVSLFSTLNSTELFTYLLPICANIAVNSDILANYVDTSLLDMSDIDWNSELENVESMLIDIVNSDVLNYFLDEEGQFIDPSQLDTNEVLISLLKDESYSYVNSALNRIDSSKLLSRAIPAIINAFSETNQALANILPTNWAELNSISWGKELSIIYDSIYTLNKVDENIIPTILSFSSSDETNNNNKDYLNNKNSDDKTSNEELIDVLVKNQNAIKTILIGEFDKDGNLINCDENGVSIVYDLFGNKINNRKYTLFDTNLFKYLAPTVFDFVTDLLNNTSLSEYTSNIDTTISELLSGNNFRKNVKEEFNSIFNILESTSESEEIMNSFKEQMNNPSADLIELANENLINDLQEVLPLIDKSKIITSVIRPFLEDTLLNNGEFADSLANVGINIEDLNLEVDNIGHEFANLLNVYKSKNLLDVLTDPTMSEDELITAVSENHISVANLLDTIFESEIINPKEEFYDDDNKNNYFDLLNYLFESSNNGSQLIDGFVFDEDKVGLYPTSNAVGNHAWNNTRNNGDYILDAYGQPILDGENGYIALVIASFGKTSENKSSPYYGKNLFQAILNEDDVSELIGYLESDFKISQVFKAVDSSSVFSASFGQFLDTTLSSVDIDLINVDEGRSFTFVEDWTQEGINFANICNSIKEVDISLNNFDITSVSNVPALNVLLHSLSNSKMFGGENSYTFNTFLYKTLQTSLPENLDLLSDPDLDENGNKTYQKAMDDFNVYLSDDLYLSDAIKDEWCNDLWIENYASLKGDLLIQTANNDPNFYSMDYISYICDFINQMNESIKNAEEESGENYEDISQALLSGYVSTQDLEEMLLSLNSVQCLRMPLYHAFELVRVNVTTETVGFDLSMMNSEYIAYDSTTKDNRASEIQCLVEIYDSFNEIKSSLGDVSNIDINQVVQNKENLIYLDSVLTNLNSSYVFHRSGPDDEYDETAFQHVAKQLIRVDGLNQIYYSDDLASKDQIDEYLISHGNYKNFEEKLDYNVDNIFAYSCSDYQNQIDECHKIVEILSSLVGGYKNVKDLTFDEDGNIVGNISDVYLGLLLDEKGEIIDFNNLDIDVINIDALNETLDVINQSDLLYDCVSNTLNYLLNNTIVEDDSEINAMIAEALKNANPYYIYTIESSTPNYDARFALKDEYNRKDINEFTILCDLLSDLRDLRNNTNDAEDDIINAIRDNKNLVLLDNVLENLNTSYVFHRGGPKDSGKTAFQLGIEKMFQIDMFETTYYSNDLASKDQIDEYLISHGNYKNFKEKLDYNVYKLFDYKTADDRQVEECHKIVETISSLVGGYKNLKDAYINEEGAVISSSNETYQGLFLNPTDPDLLLNFENVDINRVNTIALNETLNAINDSDLLYDCGPNVLAYIFDSVNIDSENKIISQILDNANPYYMYYLDGYDSPNYDARFAFENEYNRKDILEIEQLCNFIEDIKQLSIDENIDNILNMFLDKDKLVVFDDTLENLNSSYIFHRGGPKIIPNASLIDGETSFQSTIKLIVKNEGVSEFYYSDDLASKDQIEEYLINHGYYKNFEEKLDYNVDNIFAYSCSDYQNQIDECHKIVEILSSLVGGYKNVKDLTFDEDGNVLNGDNIQIYTGLLLNNDELFDLNSMQIANINENALYETLTNVNNSDLLYDCTSNMMSYLFDKFEGDDEISTMISSALKNANPYYIYTIESSTPNYDARFALKDEYNRKDADEISLLCEFIGDYNTLISQFVDVNLNTIFNLNEDDLNDVLNTFDSLLMKLSDSYIFHKANLMYLASDEIVNRSIQEATTFEYCMDFIYDNIGLTDLNFDKNHDAKFINAEEKIITKIYQMSSIDNLQLNNPNLYGSNNWNEEIFNFINLIRDTKQILPDNEQYHNNFGNFDFELNNPKLSPENINKVLIGINNCNVINDVLPNYLKNSFVNLGFEQYTQYNGNNHTQYYFDNQQEMYDSKNGIDLIKELLDNFAIYDQSTGEFKGYIVLNQGDNFFSNYLNSGKSTSMILNFIENSIIYQNYVENNNENFGVDALFIYNIFKDTNVSNLIFGNTEVEKILLLNTLLNDDSFAYNPCNEGQAFDIIFDNIITLYKDGADSFDTADIDNIKNVKDIIVKSLLCLTQSVNNDDIYAGEIHNRAYISSEIVASLLEDIIDNELKNIPTKFNLNPSNIRYFRKNINNENITNYLEIVPTSYDLLNKDEARGLDGILSLFKGTQYVNFTDYIDDLVIISSSTRLLEYENRLSNSYIGSVIYCSRLHDIFDDMFELMQGYISPETVIVKDINDLFIYDGIDGIGFVNYGDSIVELVNQFGEYLR